MIDLKKIKDENNAIYINFPFCKIPCSFCHYKENLKFGFTNIPLEYFELLMKQLEEVLSDIEGTRVSSIYLGGGTPSLITDKQCEKLFDLFRKYFVTADEVSMELHPGYCNFDFENTPFFNRYSIGVQSFDEDRRVEYRRQGYSQHDILEIYDKIRKGPCNRVINIDLIFDQTLSDIEIDNINTVRPDTVTFYPNTMGRGKERLGNILNTLKRVEKSLEGYHSLGKSKFIFIKEGFRQSLYSELEYEFYGNILGIGHNSITSIHNLSFLTKYENDRILIEKRNNNRILNLIMMGLASGVKKKVVREYLPEVYKEHFFYSVSKEEDILEKHSYVKDNELVFLPESEYIRFYETLKKLGKLDLTKVFLSSVGFGDDRYDTIEEIYNRILDLSEQEMDRLKQITGKEKLAKIRCPQKLILIEGIDGSGKDTFAHMLVSELKKRFYYSEDSKISITGEPNSRFQFGYEAKCFVEDLKYEGDSEEVIKVLTCNRIETEKYIKNLSGITILIRGLVTDKATFFRVFNKEASLGEGTEISRWDKYIVIDVHEKVADERISKRNIPRTWRESIEHLAFFRKYYLNFNSNLFVEKTIIKNESLLVLKDRASEMADSIYAETIRKSE